MMGTPKDVAEHFIGFDENSVLIAFVLQQAPSYLSRLMTEAHRIGGRTIMIADLPGFAFRPQPSHCWQRRERVIRTITRPWSPP